MNLLWIEVEPHQNHRNSFVISFKAKITVLQSTGPRLKLLLNSYFKYRFFSQKLQLHCKFGSTFPKHGSQNFQKNKQMKFHCFQVIVFMYLFTSTFSIRNDLPDGFPRRSHIISIALIFFLFSSFFVVIALDTFSRRAPGSHAALTWPAPRGAEGYFPPYAWRSRVQSSSGKYSFFFWIVHGHRRFKKY